MFKTYIFVLLAVIFCGQLSFAAFEISPVIMTVSPSGPDATVSLTVINTGDLKTPVQISVFRRDPDVDGKEKYEDSKDMGDLFQIIPSQFILNPKEKRTVRITYVGDPKMKQELSFRVIAEEFPINVTDPEKVKNKAVASIAIVSKYVASLYVKPQGTAPDVAITASLTKEKKMELVFQNKGTEHQILKNMKYKVTVPSQNKEYPMPPDSVAAIGVQNILAGKSRKFVIPWPQGIPMVEVKVAIDNTTTTPAATK